MVTCDVASQSNSAARGSGRSADPHTLHHYPDHPQLWVGHDQVGLGGRLRHDRSDDPEEPLRVYGFQARVRAAHAVPETMRDLAADNERLVTELAQTAAALKDEQARTAPLRRALTEASIELERASQVQSDRRPRAAV
jgi:hypothetical protein